MCAEKEALPAATEQSPSKRTEPILTPEEGFVNRHEALRAKYRLSRAQIIEALREKYPAFDKALESKCEHPDRYGIELTVEAWMYLIDKFGGKTEDGQAI